MTTIEACAIVGVQIARPEVHADDRGRFVQSYRADWFPEAGPMVQANHTERRAGTLVGLHFHRHQTDYWYVVRGHARAVLFDLRAGSPSEGATAVFELGEVDGGEHNHLGLLIPPGIAHGFAALADTALTYLVDAVYDPADELGVAWDDPAVDASWGLTDPILSDRDRSNPRLADLAERPPFPPGAS